MNLLRQICKWYFSRKALPYWCILVWDCFLLYLVGLVSYYTQYGGSVLAGNFWAFSGGLGLSMILYVIMFRLYHTYSGILRYSSFRDLLHVGFAMVWGTVLVWLLNCCNAHLQLVPGVIMPNANACLLILVFGTLSMIVVRILVKQCYEICNVSDDARRVFIYGCLEGGVSLGKSISSNNNGKYVLTGFVNPSASYKLDWLLGCKVYPYTDNIVRIMQRARATVLLISPIQREHFRQQTDLINSLLKAGIRIMIMPAAEEWDGKSDFTANQLHEIDIEDLLLRDKIEIDLVAIGQMLRGERILITGAAGSIGSEIARQVAEFLPSELILIDQAETPMHDMRRWAAGFIERQKQATMANLPHIETIVGSITNAEQMKRIFAQKRPTYVFHAAAYKHVPMMEDNPAVAVQNNVYGTRVIADLAVKYGTKKFVMVSTDKAVNPTNVMGCSKRICEIYCQALNNHLKDESAQTGKAYTQFITTRFGNVLGSNGSVIPIFKEQIRRGGPVTVTHPDIQRFFMLISEACRLVLEAGTMGHGGEIFVFDMGKPVRIADLAQRMIELSGATNVAIKYCGLRDGEKLYEEVLNDKETTQPTIHPKIKVASVREYPYKLALQNEMELYELSFGYDDMAIVKKMKDIVPEYKSQNSKYQTLDE